MCLCAFYISGGLIPAKVNRSSMSASCSFSRNSIILSSFASVLGAWCTGRNSFSIRLTVSSKSLRYLSEQAISRGVSGRVKSGGGGTIKGSCWLLLGFGTGRSCNEFFPITIISNQKLSIIIIFTKPHCIPYASYWLILEPVMRTHFLSTAHHFAHPPEPYPNSRFNCYRFYRI